MGTIRPNQKATERGTPTVAELADRFMADHVRAKRRAGTAEFYRDILDRIVKPTVGTTKADKLTRLQVGRLHSSLADTPFQANRVLAAVGSMYSFAGHAGFLPEGTNPARGIEKFKESRRERFLTSEELGRLGRAIREAETTGIPWTVDESKPNAKHVPKAKRSTRIALSAAAALRLLMFTGCRLREILLLRWEHVDIERGCLFLPDSKSGRKTVILNARALAVLNAMERVGPYVVPGDDPQQPRHDLKRPWDAVTKRAGLTGVRLHDLRHTYASFGAGGGLGLPRLLAGFWATLRQRPPRAMRISTTIRCGALQKQLPGVSQPHLRAARRPQFDHCVEVPGACTHKSRLAAKSQCPLYPRKRTLDWGCPLCAISGPSLRCESEAEGRTRLRAADPSVMRLFLKFLG
jgi:integrase